MSNFNLAVYDGRGRVIGHRCINCGGVFQSMWGNTCNGCRDAERRHRELIAAIEKAASAERGEGERINEE